MSIVRGKLTESLTKLATDPRKLSPAADPRFGDLTRGSAALAYSASTMLIRDDSDAQRAATALGKVKQAQAKVTELTDFFITPLKQHLKSLDAMFRPVKAELDEAKRLLGTKLAEYQEAKEAVEANRIAELNAATLAQAETEGPAAVAEVHTAIRDAAQAEVGGPIVTGTCAVKFREVLDFEITDFASVPDAYKVPNEVSIWRAGRADVTIPGVTFFRRKTTATY